MSKNITCTVLGIDEAEEILSQLKSKGFLQKNISVLFPDRADVRKWIQDEHTQVSAGIVAGVSTGGMIGGILGWLAGIGSLAIPDIAGLLMVILGTGAVGAAFGGMTGIFLGLGIPEYQSQIYRNKVKEGSILISVNTKDSEKLEEARDIFEEVGASNIFENKVKATKKENLPENITSI